MNNILKYNIPFRQAPVINYIAKEIPHRFSHKITNIANISIITRGICHGLSNAFIMYENNNKGKDYINEINGSFNCINSINSINSINENKNTFRKYYLDSIKLFSNANFDQLISTSINNQSDYDKSYYFNEMYEDVNKFNLPIRTKNQSNFDFIKKIITENKIKDTYNNPIHLIDESEVIDYIYFFFDSVTNPKSTKYGESSRSSKFNNLPEIRVENEIQNKIKKNEILTNDEIKCFLKIAYQAIAQYIDLKMTSKKLNAGLINDDTKPINHKNNNSYTGECISISKIKENIERKISNNKKYYCLFEVKEHCMAISVNFDKYNKPIYNFFEPNEGIITTNDEGKFIKILERVLNNFNKEGKAYKNDLDEPVVYVQEIESKSGSNNRITPSKVNLKDVQHHIKKSLIKDKAKLDLSENYKLQLTRHDLEKNIIKGVIYGFNHNIKITSKDMNIDRMVTIINKNIAKINVKTNALLINSNYELEKNTFSKKVIKLKNILKKSYNKNPVDSFIHTTKNTVTKIRIPLETAI